MTIALQRPNERAVVTSEWLDRRKVYINAWFIKASFSEAKERLVYQGFF